MSKICAVWLCCILLAACGPTRRTEPADVSHSLAAASLPPRDAHPAVEALETPVPLFERVSPASARSQAALLDREALGLRSWTELAPALERSLAYARSWDPEARATEHSGVRLTWGDVAVSLETLSALLPELDAHPERLAENFVWLRVTPDVKFTGYYSPVMRASRTRKPGYEYPIYRLPEELAPDLAWCLASHSCPEDAFLQVIRPETPYYTGRRSIWTAHCGAGGWKWRGSLIRSTPTISCWKDRAYWPLTTARGGRPCSRA